MSNNGTDDTTRALATLPVAVQTRAAAVKACAQCGKQFPALRGDRHPSGRFCSLQCAGAARRKYPRIDVTCKVCGRAFTPKKTHLQLIHKEPGKHEHCSNKCAAADGRGFQKANTVNVGRKHSEDYIAKLRVTKGKERSPSWTGDRATAKAGHLRAWRWFAVPGECECCHEKKKLDRHHKDRNPVNNDPSNIAFLCRKCHQEADGRLTQRADNGRLLKINADA